jgi:hypothetical protein
MHSRRTRPGWRAGIRIQAITAHSNDWRICQQTNRDARGRAALKIPDEAADAKRLSKAMSNGGPLLNQIEAEVQAP